MDDQHPSDEQGEEVLDTAECHKSTSPWFGALLGPTVIIVREETDGHADTKSEVD